ncbi:Hypothetical protein NTJ_03158 [Nesidiocoris tenuis]|uniref:A-kinase anchor protein 12-like n=1 Tax=Nesidiocoris tenuis TaxID=355587 RepID=A0ABN7AE94_9HEMI|nr:Hypothetical protein NTJ_03158 [Nesidiocoris tenuis]
MTLVNDSTGRNPQGSGLSPSSTAESAKQISDVDTRANDSRPPSVGNISCDKPPEEPESVDTSHGVEATAVRKLAASTGTVAILGTTAQTPSKEPSSGFVDEPIVEIAAPKKNEEKSVENGPKEPIREIVTEETAPLHSKSEKSEAPSTAPEPEKTESPSQVAEVVYVTPAQNEIRQVPEITETLVASLEPSPVEESNPPIQEPPDIADDKAEQNSENASEAGKLVDVESDRQVAQDNPPKTPKTPAPSDEAKSENNDSTSTKTVDNDISSEQFKTNSLSDLSISELDDKESSALEQKASQKEAAEDEGKLDEPSGESERSESDLKVTELTYESPSESSQPITKEESTSDVTTDNQQGESQLMGDEEPLVSETSDDDVGHRNEAAIKIQSSFRGFKTRKTLSVRRENRDVETEEDDKLTESEIENVKVQVEGMMKEAEETTESLRNTPDVDNEPSANAEEDFPAPPDAALLDEIEANEGPADVEKDTTSLNLEPVPYPNSDADGLKSKDQPTNPSSSDLKQQSSTENGDNTSADLVRMTADEDLPAPDMELLESSCTEDLNTEIINSEKVLDDDHHDSTEGDLTIDEDSEKLKELQKPQECDELARVDDQSKGDEDADAASTDKPNQDAAATKIQANVRGFLTRKQVYTTFHF